LARFLIVLGLVILVVGLLCCGRIWASSGSADCLATSSSSGKILRSISRWWRARCWACCWASYFGWQTD